MTKYLSVRKIPTLLYLDDLFSSHPDIEVHREQWSNIVSTRCSAGFVLSVPKTEVNQRRMEHVGLGYDSITGRTFLGDKKMEKIFAILGLVRAGGVSLRTCAQLAGKFISVDPVYPALGGGLPAIMRHYLEGTNCELGFQDNLTRRIGKRT